MSGDLAGFWDSSVAFSAGDFDFKQIPTVGGVVTLWDVEQRAVQTLSAADMRRAVIARLAPPESTQPSKRVALAEVVSSISWKQALSAFEIDLRYIELLQRLEPESWARTLNWTPATFLRIERNGVAPSITPTTHLSHDASELIGPFMRRSDADEFVKTLGDMFDLCRYPAEIQRIPNGKRCAYFDMGRCDAPCDGTAPIAPYRQRFADAVRFLRGDHRQLQALEQSMQSAASGLRFEAAASYRETLQRGRQLVERASTQWVVPMDQFLWFVVQYGARPVKAVEKCQFKLFVIHGRTLSEWRSLPLDEFTSVAFSAMNADVPGESADRRDVLKDDAAIRLACRYLQKGERGPGLFLTKANPTSQDSLNTLIRSRFAKSQAPS